jgi:hypothetical protein
MVAPALSDERKLGGFQELDLPLEPLPSRVSTGST